MVRTYLQHHEEVMDICIETDRTKYRCRIILWDTVYSPNGDTDAVHVFRMPHHTIHGCVLAL